MSIFNFNRKKTEAPGDSYNAAVDKAYKANERRLASKEARQRRVEDIAAVLDDCQFTFQKTIAFENSLAGEMQRKGLPVTEQKKRVRNAAIGILVVEQARYELKSISSESDLNSAMNKMGMALRQLKRVNNSSAAVSSSTERIVRQWYPEGLVTKDENENAAAASLPEVPAEIASIIDEAFVQNMMLGDSFEMAMAKRNLAPKVDPTRAQRDAMMNEVYAATGVQEPAQTDHSSVVSQYDNKY